MLELKLSNRKSIFKNEKDTIILNNDNIVSVEDCKGKRIKVEHKKNFDHNNMYIRLGFLQGDGCLGRLNSKEHKGLEVNIGKKDKELLSLFDLNNENKRRYYITGYNEILKSLKFDSRQLPFREFPLLYKSFSKANKKSFLRGLYSANGCVVKGYRVAFKTTCKNLSDQLIENLKEFGIDSYKTTNKSKKVKFDNGEYICKESYDINITKLNSLVSFYNLIGFVQEYKVFDLENLISIKSPKVMSIIRRTNETKPR